ncbi:MAG: DUF4301 family protein [Deltaproteobacteria bacterium]|nr:DUF4301 family protein [Deltaproteobacteria bacterium]
MNGLSLNKEDLDQIKKLGITTEQVNAQIEMFKRGFPFSKLNRSTTVGDGIIVLQQNELERLGDLFLQAALSGRTMKFVPASGAASRMFKLLLSFNNRYEQIDEKYIRAEAEKDDTDHQTFLRFIRGIKSFAFYDDLKTAMSGDDVEMETLISEGQYKEILEYLLTSEGLNLSNLPKGLIKFHQYPDHSRTPFEEHMVEAAAYTQDSEKNVRIHFTVSPEHEDPIQAHIMNIRDRYEKSGIRYDLSFSVQKTATDTIAVDMENNPFRDRDGRLLFRPGGHGALLENLNDLKGDIIFIKNIDNVVPDRIKQATYVYKKALGGYLIELQNKIADYLGRLLSKDVDEPLINQALDFARHKLSIIPSEGVVKGSKDEKIEFLISRLNRPLRVCGMVKNVGEPGGGPFWVEHGDGTTSLQIVESSQVDMKSAEQKVIWESSTHFNPVDLICGVHDYLGDPFNLMNYTDPDTGFISIKSKEGRELKALELPGLWNGAMANWNSVFIEVPIITFNPVKTVMDLLREEHQPA